MLAYCCGSCRPHQLVVVDAKYLVIVAVVVVVVAGDVERRNLATFGSNAYVNIVITRVQWTVNYM